MRRKLPNIICQVEWLPPSHTSTSTAKGTARYGMAQLLTVLWLASLLLASPASAQNPYVPPAAPMAPYGPQPPVAQYPQPAAPRPGPYTPQAAPGAQQQQPLHYAFRPDLSNQQYGECLGLEQNWKNLWQQYAQGYQQVQYMNQSDPRYAQLTYYLADLRRQVDAAWAAFSSKCVYFRAR
jgi:hypothetical protein